MLFHPIYLMLGIFSLVYAAPLNAAIKSTDLNSGAPSFQSRGVATMHLKVRKQAISSGPPDGSNGFHSSLNNNVVNNGNGNSNSNGDGNGNGNRVHIGHLLAPVDDQFEIWFSDPSSTPESTSQTSVSPVVPPNDEIRTRISRAIGNHRRDSFPALENLVFRQTCPGRVDHIWYRQIGGGGPIQSLSIP